MMSLRYSTSMTASGTFGNGSEYVELGRGGRNVLILPGYEGEILNSAGHPLMVRSLLQGFDTEGCTVRYVNRISGIPDGYTTRDMATDYAEILRPETLIIGISLGGMVAQHLADISDDVKTLTVCNSGPDDSDAAERHLAENLERARAGDWNGFSRGLTWDVDGWVQKQLFSAGRLSNGSATTRIVATSSTQARQHWSMIAGTYCPRSTFRHCW